MSEKLHKKTDHTSDNSDSEFYDAPESISSKLNEQEEIIEDDDDDDYDQDFESEKLDLLKKFDKKFNLDTNEPSPTTTTTSTETGEKVKFKIYYFLKNSLFYLFYLVSTIT